MSPAGRAAPLIFQGFAALGELAPEHQSAGHQCEEDQRRRDRRNGGDNARDRADAEARPDELGRAERYVTANEHPLDHAPLLAPAERAVGHAEQCSKERHSLAAAETSALRIAEVPGDALLDPAAAAELYEEEYSGQCEEADEHSDQERAER